MAKNAIYEHINELAHSRFSSKKDLTALQLIYGYAALLSMDENVRNVLIGEDADKKEIEEIRGAFERMELDLRLVKTGIPLFEGYERNREEECRKIKELDLALEDTDDKATQMLGRLFAMDLPELQMLTVGHQIEDLLDFAKERGPVRESRTGKKEEPKPEAAIKKESAFRKESTVKKEESPKQSKQDPKEEEAGLSERERLQILASDIRRMYGILLTKVKGQNEAVRLFAQGYFQSEVFKRAEENRKKPGASFLFVGPPGVGKTFLAESAADCLGRPFLRLNMSEYNTQDGVHRLCGYPKSYQGTRDGTLSAFVTEHPDAVILADEIEKAHEEVLFQFLQVLEGAELTNQYTGKKVDFRRTILIFTSNVGKSLYEDHGRSNLAALPRPVVIKALEEEKDELDRPRLSPALISRFSSGNLLMFNHLEAFRLLEIIQESFRKGCASLRELYGLEMEMDPKLGILLLYENSTMADARNMSAQSELLIKNQLYELDLNLVNAKEAMPGLEKLRLLVDYREDGEEVRNLFENSEDSYFLYVGDPARMGHVPFAKCCRMIQANSYGDIKDILSAQEIDFAVIDPLYKPMQGQDFLGIEDRKTEGLRIFETLTEKLPDLPVYMLEDGNIGDHDRRALLEMGVRDVIPFGGSLDFADRVAGIREMNYMQKMLKELSGHGRVLSYRTAQRITDEGKTAEIVFYDLRIKMATNAEENRMMMADAERPKERLDDVIGAENAKDELRYFLGYLKNPRSFIMRGEEAPRGILLYGPPGTGKTMLARAMAGESDTSFYMMSGTSFSNKYYGESEQRIRTLFANARKFAPSIIFIDEIDAIGKERNGSEFSEHREKELNTLLAEMNSLGDRGDASRPVFVIAATNYGVGDDEKKNLDQALVRRFDKAICVDLPNREERRKYLKMQIEKRKLTVSEDAISSLADRTGGMSLALMENVLNTAVRKAFREKKELNDEILLEALDDQRFGEKKEWSEDIVRATAVHEAGHAYVSVLGGGRPTYVTVSSRGNFGGYTAYENSEDKMDMTREELLWRIRSALAGRAAEVVFYGEERGINTGAGGDLKQATHSAMHMICSYGMMQGKLFSISPEQVMKSSMAKEFADQVNDLLEKELEYTLQLVREGKDRIEAFAEYLVKNSSATEQTILEFLKKE